MNNINQCRPGQKSVDGKCVTIEKSQHQNGGQVVLWILAIVCLIGVSIFIYVDSHTKDYSNNVTAAAILNQNSYNGDMEHWCIRAPTDVGRGYGFLDGTTTRCTSSNSAPYLAPTYDGLHNPNEIPTMWWQMYGCCPLRSTDAHSGQYSVIVHKAQTDDWEFFGRTKSGMSQSFIPASPEKIYNLSVYYKFILNSPTEKRVSISLKFYDSTFTEISGSGKSAYFNPTTTWTQVSIGGKAPSNTAYIGWMNSWAQMALGDLYLDDLVIDEGMACEPGIVENCGSYLGVCTVGTRTCSSTGNWGACSGVNPTPDVCSDGLDNDCDGNVDEGCIFTPYTVAEYIELFDAIISKTHDGYGFSDANSPTWWAWDNAPIVEAWENMYMATGFTKYLDKVVVNTDRLISKASIDPYNLATGGELSPYLGWYTLEHPIDPILTYSRNIFPMIKFAYIVKKDNLQQYMTKADQYINFVESNFIPVYDSIWHECGEMGFWSEGTASAPNNRASFVGRTHLYLWLITNNEKYHDRALKYANKIKSTLLERTDANGNIYYYWNYANKAGCTTVGTTYQCSYTCAAETRNECVTNPTAWTCAGNLETGYGNYDVALMLDFYEAGIVFTNLDVQKLVNTFKQSVVNTTEVGETVDDLRPQLTIRWKVEPDGPQLNDKGYYSFAGGSHHWARLGHYDSSVKNIFDQINKWILEDAKVEGVYYNHAYNCVRDTRSPSSATCITPATSGWDDDLRSTPAYSVSRIGHQLLESEHLAPVACAQETDPQFCTRLGKTCGEVTALDNCGITRTVLCNSVQCEENDGDGGNNDTKFEITPEKVIIGASGLVIIILAIVIIVIKKNAR